MYIDPSLFQTLPTQLPNVFTPGSPLAWNVLNGTAYLFGAKGDTIPEHAHPVGQNHIIAVLQGAVDYALTNADGSVTTTNYAAPAILVVPPDLVHSVTVTSDPINPAGPTVQDSTTLAAITIHLMMSALQPAAIKAQLSGVIAPALAAIQAQITNAVNLANGTAT